MKGSCLPSWAILLFVWLSSTAVLSAAKYLSHCAVGESRLGTRTISAEAELILKFKRGGRTPVATLPAKGQIQFLDQNGSPASVKVMGGGFSGESVQEISYSLVAGQRRFQLNGESGLQVFWIRITELQGEVSGQLQFFIDENGQRVTDVTVDASSGGFVNEAFSAKFKGSDRTGIALANPSSESVPYLVELRDLDDRVIERKWKSLVGGGQTASFVNEIFGEISDGFEGSLIIASDKKMAAVALNQNGLELSTAGVETDSEGANYFAFGTAAQFEDPSAGSMDIGPEYRGKEVERPYRQAVTSGNVFFQKGATTITTSISGEGAFLADLPEGGEWKVTVESPGLVLQDRVFSFPRPPLDIDLINPQKTNMCVLRASQVNQKVYKPSEDLKFLFDSSIPDGVFQGGGVCESVQDSVWASVKQFVDRQLPALGLSGSYESLRIPPGNILRNQNGVPVCWEGIEGLVIVTPNPGLETAARAIPCVPRGSSEVIGGYIEYAAFGSSSGSEFQESCSESFTDSEMISGVSQRFWSALFVQGFMEASQCGLDPVETIRARNSLSVYPSPLDAAIIELLAKRPAGTVFEGDREVLPPEFYNIPESSKITNSLSEIKRGTGFEELVID